MEISVIYGQSTQLDMYADYVCTFLCKEIKRTFVAEVIYQDNFSQVLSGSPFNDTVDGPHERRPTLIMENYYHTGRQQPIIIVPVLTPEKKTKGEDSNIKSF